MRVEMAVECEEISSAQAETAVFDFDLDRNKVLDGGGESCAQPCPARLAALFLRRCPPLTRFATRRVYKAMQDPDRLEHYQREAGRCREVLLRRGRRGRQRGRHAHEAGWRAADGGWQAAVAVGWPEANEYRVETALRLECEAAPQKHTNRRATGRPTKELMRLPYVYGALGRVGASIADTGHLTRRPSTFAHSKAMCFLVRGIAGSSALPP